MRLLQQLLWRNNKFNRKKKLAIRQKNGLLRRKIAFAWISLTVLHYDFIWTSNNVLCVDWELIAFK